MTVKSAQFYKGWDLQAVFGNGKQWCPVCGSRNFTAYEPAGGLFCDQCGARFACRDTAGDPGLVVDCFPAGYDEHGIFKGRAVKYWIDPARGGHRGLACDDILVLGAPDEEHDVTPWVLQRRRRAMGRRHPRWLTRCLHPLTSAMYRSTYSSRSSAGADVPPDDYGDPPIVNGHVCLHGGVTASLVAWLQVDPVRSLVGGDCIVAYCVCELMRGGRDRRVCGAWLRSSGMGVSPVTSTGQLAR